MLVELTTVRFYQLLTIIYIFYKKSKMELDQFVFFLSAFNEKKQQMQKFVQIQAFCLSTFVIVQSK